MNSSRQLLKPSSATRCLFKRLYLGYAVPKIASDCLTVWGLCKCRRNYRSHTFMESPDCTEPLGSLIHFLWPSPRIISRDPGPNTARLCLSIPVMFHSLVNRRLGNTLFSVQRVPQYALSGFLPRTWVQCMSRSTTPPFHFHHPQTSFSQLNQNSILVY